MNGILHATLYLLIFHRFPVFFYFVMCSDCVAAAVVSFSIFLLFAFSARSVENISDSWREHFPTGKKIGKFSDQWNRPNEWILEHFPTKKYFPKNFQRKNFRPKKFPYHFFSWDIFRIMFLVGEHAQFGNAPAADSCDCELYGLAETINKDASARCIFREHSCNASWAYQPPLTHETHTATYSMAYCLMFIGVSNESSQQQLLSFLLSQKQTEMSIKRKFMVWRVNDNYFYMFSKCISSRSSLANNNNNNYVAQLKRTVKFNRYTE